MSLPQALQSFQWVPQPAAAQVVRQAVDRFVARCPVADDLAVRMREQTGTRFSDWLDHLVVGSDDPAAGQLAAAGFAIEATSPGEEVYVHRQGLFPRVLLRQTPGELEAAIKVESVADFAAVNGISRPIEGPPLGQYRRLCVCQCDETRLWAVERHGYGGYRVPPLDPYAAIAAAEFYERFRARRRQFDSEVEGFEHAGALLDEAVGELGADVVCDLFFRAEREYWMSRNRAAQAQYARQQRLGLGWANHDHHTYRSSRRHFTRLVGMWEKLGFACRERFYAGAEAGWGAQVMEQPVCGIVTFNDVDLAPREVLVDFAHEPLAERRELGTVGLWCGLHGESFLEAGMHHLECQFDFAALKEQLAAQAGIAVMAPFTDLPYLKQAFTEGEHWPVRPQRVQALLAAGQINREQADKFRLHGAIGSHLEDLQREEGYKGFNQQGVSQIISRTDPRRQ